MEAYQRGRHKASESIVELKERLWNKDIEGAWRKDHGEVDFGIKK